MVDGTIAESQSFTPYGLRRGSQLQNGYLLQGANESGSFVPSRDVVGRSEIGGQARRHTVDAGEAVYAYFLNQSMTELTRSDFMRLGGIEFHQEPVDSTTGSFAAMLLASLGERAVPVQVGSFQGALTWADPDVGGIRTHNIYWSDGLHNFALIANRSGADVVTLARDLACS
jgi:hypothetical protein